MATTYLSRTAGTPTNSDKWTFSTWVKSAWGGTSTSGNEGTLIGTRVDANNYEFVGFDSQPRLRHYLHYSGSASGQLKTTAKYRDFSAWYHVVYVWDSGNADASLRQRMYVNGAELSAFDTDDNAALNQDSLINTSGNTVCIGVSNTGDPASFFEGSLAHTHFCDGQAYAASDFGETDSTSGIWVAKTSPSVTYGNNGFFLKYASGASGTDSSGNSNDFTVSGTMTNLKDSPDNNFATGNFLYSGYTYPTGATEGNGNTTWTGTTGWRGTYSTLGAASGKWYGEFKCASSAGANNCVAGFLNAATNEDISDAAVGQPASTAALTNAGVIMQDGSDRVSALTTYTTGDIVSCAIDITNGFMYWAVNGTWVNSGDPTSGATGTGGYAISNIATGGLYLFGVGGDGATSWNMNFGNGYFGTTAISTAGTSSSGDDSIWEYDCPTGYYGLNTNNLGSFS